MIAALCFVTLALADPSATFAAANDAIAAGDLPSAEAGLRTLVNEGYTDADVYYNLGNVLWRAEAPADAVLAWRRAQALAPRDPDIAANLDFGRRSLVDGIAPAYPAPALAPWMLAVTAGEATWLGCALLGVGLLVAGASGRAHALRKRDGAAVAAAAVAVGLGLALVAGAEAHVAGPRAAVVRVASVKATSDLGGGIELFELHAGAEVLAPQVAAGHTLVQLPDGRRGWVPDAAVGVVDPALPLPAR